MKRLLAVLLALLLIGSLCIECLGATEGTQTIRLTVPAAVTLNIGEHGSVTVNGITYTGDASFTLPPGTVLTYSFTPDEGYEISNILYNGVDVTASVTDGVYTAPQLTDNATLTVVFQAVHVHDWEDEYTVDKEPTCTESGSKSIHCKGCDAVKDSIEIPALGHAWDEGVVIRSATDTTEGQMKYTCTRCGEVRYETIPPQSVVQTGDESHPDLWFLLMIVSGMVLIPAVIIVKRRRKAS